MQLGCLWLVPGFRVLGFRILGSKILRFRVLAEPEA